MFVLYYFFAFVFIQKIGLQLKAQLENLTKLKPDGEDFRWYLKVAKIFGFQLCGKTMIDAGFKQCYHPKKSLRRAYFSLNRYISIYGRKWSNGVVVTALDYQSRGLMFKTTRWLLGQLNPSSF